MMLETKVTSHVKGDTNPATKQDIELLTKALLLAINEINLLHDRVGRLEADI